LGAVVARIVFGDEFGRQFAGGQTHFELDVKNVRQLIRVLDEMFPGIGEHLEAGAIAIDNEIIPDPWLNPIQPDSEVFFLPPIRGGGTEWLMNFAFYPMR
jgi:sulfur-carrier protein